MRYPKFLNEGGTIGVVAPSKGLKRDSDLTKLAFSNLANKGFNFKLGKLTYGKRKEASGSSKSRARDFTRMYLDPSIDFLIAAKGGESECLILEYLNYKRLMKSEPKWVMGFSDNTFILYMLLTHLDVAGIYGDHFSMYGFSNWDYSIRKDYDFLLGRDLRIESLPKYQSYEAYFNVSTTSEEYIEPYVYDRDSTLTCLTKENEVNLNGRVIVGCLDCFDQICGTKFDKTKEFIEKYKDDGIIWFIESCDLTVMGQLRGLWQLKMSGWFKYAKAIVLGHPMVSKTMDNVTHLEASYRALKNLGIPVIADFDFGHLGPRLPIINGAKANLNYRNNKLEVKFTLE